MLGSPQQNVCAGAVLVSPYIFLCLGSGSAKTVAVLFLQLPGHNTSILHFIQTRLVKSCALDLCILGRMSGLEINGPERVINIVDNLELIMQVFSRTTNVIDYVCHIFQI